MTGGWMEVAAGALTGLVVGLTGVGGGALMTPILLLGFGVAPVTAIGTDLWFAALTKSVAVPAHQGRGLIDWEIAKRLWMGSLPAALVMVGLLKVGIIGAHHPRFLTLAISGAVILTALGLMFRGKFAQRDLATADPGDSLGHRGRMALTLGSGVVLGFLVTLTSIGAGALGAIFLAYLYPTRLTPARLVATDLVHAIPLALFAGLGHLMVGKVDMRLLTLLLCGSIPGVLVGAKLVHHLPQAVLRWTMAAVLLVVGIKLWVSR